MDSPLISEAMATRSLPAAGATVTLPLSGCDHTLPPGPSRSSVNQRRRFTLLDKRAPSRTWCILELVTRPSLGVLLATTALTCVGVACFPIPNGHQACIEAVEAAGAAESSSGPVAEPLRAALVERCRWVHLGCPRSNLYLGDRPWGRMPSPLVELCPAPTCDDGRRASPACEAHWREQLDATQHTPDALLDNLTDYHRAAVGDGLANMRTELEPAQRELIARSWARLWAQSIAEMSPAQQTKNGPPAY